jgi:hypothetical protein
MLLTRKRFRFRRQCRSRRPGDECDRCDHSMRDSAKSRERSPGPYVSPPHSANGIAVARGLSSTTSEGELNEIETDFVDDGGDPRAWPYGPCRERRRCAGRQERHHEKSAPEQARREPWSQAPRTLAPLTDPIKMAPLPPEGSGDPHGPAAGRRGPSCAERGQFAHALDLIGHREGLA